MTKLNARPVLAQKPVRKVAKPVTKPVKRTIEEKVKWTADQFMKLLKGDPEVYYRMYKANERALRNYKTEVLAKFHGKVVQCEGTLAKRGEGDWGNLNLVVNLTIDGVLVDHLSIYDEFIDELGVEQYETFKFEAVVYGYHRNDKYGRDLPHGYGLKPVWMPLNKRRNEF